MKIREASIKYGKSKKENIKQKKDDIEKSMKTLEARAPNENIVQNHLT